ncbi:poly(R)-hydroxyalkanoic acid synthase subunit PhaE [Candidatus Magnetaquicoccus inordinatus]|uniref:poly(R)-hydroxyalkanoic acid synthase subunit PhaE n=1 Tax=Candidatus Magnetaquicoccus inordinatus TaxID=2496818 RepID=UPI00102AE65A|nr:poly(R)-hydroxyalkanoic acid synthase subunit PhaE [Candidatus Magnetaquicoccus inordinatus]
MANDAFSVDWMQGWADLQRKIWNEWSAMAGEHLQTNRSFSAMPGMEGMAQWPMQWLKQVSEGATTAGNSMPWTLPWMQPQASSSPLDEWTRMFGIYTPEASPEKTVMNGMLSAASGFMRMSKEIFDALQRIGESQREGGEWTKHLDRAIQQAKSFFTGQEGAQAALHPMAAWSQPMQMWMDMFKDNPLLSSNLMQTMASAVKPEVWNQESGLEWLRKVLATPGLGLTREKQERMQAAMNELLNYQKAMQEFQTLSNQVNLKALDLLHKRLLERGATNKPIESLKELYVLWVDCCEETNAEFVRSETFQQANSRMVNGMIRVQQYQQGMADEMMSAVGMPTRREMNTSHRQVQELKRRVRNLEDQLKRLQTQDHGAELRSLRDDLERLDVGNLRQELADMKSILEDARPGVTTPPEKASASANKARAAARDKVGATSDTVAKKGE